MAKDPFDTSLAGFRRWAKTAADSLRGGDPVEDAAEVELLTGLMRDYLDIERPADLSEHDLAELLLRVYPRKVVVDSRAEAEDTVRVLHAFLAYLADSGAMREPSARSLARELDKIAPRFADAVMDPANWGPGRMFAQSMAADGVDIGDQDAVRRYIDTYNARLPHPHEDDEYDDEGVDLKEAFGLPDEMAPMRLPSVPELAAMARSAPMIGQLRALADWLGTGRAVTENGDLRGADVAEAAAVLGIGIPVMADDRALPGMAELPAVGRMRDVPQIEYLWQLALDSGFIELDDDETHAVRGEVAEAWEDIDAEDDELLEAWDTVFALVVATTLDVAAGLDPRRSAELDLAGQGIGLAVMLFLGRGDGIPVAEISEVVRSIAVGELAPARAAKAWQSWVRAHGDPARLLLDQMAAVGGVQIRDSRDSGDDELARLSPLGLAAVRTQFIESGVEIPLLPPADEMTAAELIASADGATEEEFLAETTAWLTHRTAEDAATELLSVAAEADAASRVLAVGLVTELGAAAEAAWRAALGRLELSGYAKASLGTLAGADLAAPSQLTPDELAWILTDGFAVDGWDDVDDETDRDPAALAERLRDAIPVGQEAAAFEMMARVPHPQAADVLTGIGRYYPDKQIAKAARKAAYKASSRLAARNG
jgi:hypothetical protein